MIDLLARPITDLLGSFGSGIIPSGGPSDVLRMSSEALDSVQSVGRSAVSELAHTWSGPAAAAAIDLAEQAHTSAAGLSAHGTEIAAIVDRACEKVYAGLAEIQSIAASFLSVAAAAAPALVTPAGQTLLITTAIDHLQRALAVLARVRAELAVHAGEITACSTPPPVPAPAGGAAPVPGTAPAAAVPDPGSRFVENFVRTVSSSAPSMTPDGSSSLLTNPAAATPSSPSPSSMPSAMSTITGATPRPGGAPSGPEAHGPDAHGADVQGVEVALPDGSVAVAPNEQAAGAVRSALTQQGTPYVWGGTEPGRGLDCSGLTQWAYAEQGVELPRLAQEQNVGSQIRQDEVMPGDLAVWDGHVAMVIGNGQIVEAGDPVQVGDIRTTNSGMSFTGFFRPTT